MTARSPLWRTLAGLLALGAPCVALAQAQIPNLNLLDAAAGETEVEVEGFLATRRPANTPGFQFNSEMTHVFSDRLALQFQMTGHGEGQALRADELSLQALLRMVAWSNGSGGISVETTVDPTDGGMGLGGLLYATVAVGGWRTGLNFGAEAAASGETADLVYAWSTTRTLSGNLAGGLTGGGSTALKGGEADQHYVGPALTWRLSDAAEGSSLTFGYLVGLTPTSPSLARLGTSLDF